MGEIESPAEFREVFMAHREAVYRFAWRLTGRSHDAEDLTQETFVTFWRKRDQFRGEGSLAGYLRRIAWRTFLNSRARLSARHPPRPIEEAPEPAAAEEAGAETRDAREYLRRRVMEALESLPDMVRETFLLFRFEGMKVAEVAEVTGAPVKTVESRLKRAHEVLAARLSRYRDQLMPR